MSNINISVTEQDPINVSIASPEVQNVDVTGQSISASVPDGDKGDIVVTGNGTIWTLDPNALSTRVPYTGATQDVNLGEFGLLTGNIEFDTTPTNAPTGAGSMVWNDTEGTVDLKLKGASVTLPIGQKQVVRAVNGTGGNLTRAAYRAVKVTGAQGQRMQVNLARADNDANSKDTIGLVGEDISNNQEGFIVTSGLIENINTTGSLQGETWADGDTLYLSGATLGVITNVKPSAPTHTVILGFVIYAHANNGKIYVKVNNGYELDELHNVNVSTAASGDYLRYNGTTWVDATILAADLPTGIDAAKIGTGVVSNTEFGYLDGVTSAIQTQLNGKQATLTNPVTGTGASGQVTYFSGTSAVTGSNNLFWDNTNTRLGVGTASPTQKLDILDGSLIVRQTSPTNNSVVSPGAISFTNSGGGIIDNLNAALFIQSNSQFIFRKSAPDYTEWARINTGGNFSIGNTNNTYNLDVSGTLRNTTSAYFATSSGGVSIGTTVINNAYLRVYGGTNVPTLALQNDTSGVLTNDGFQLQISNNIAYVWNYENQAMLFGTNGTERIRINAGGNVSIGNTNNTYNLDISGTLRNTTDAYFATSSGNVGVGTTNPLWKLTISGNDMAITDGTTNTLVTSSNNFSRIRSNTNLVFDTGSSYTQRAIINTNGNFGLGTSNFGTSATITLALFTGVAPTTSPADAFQMYSADITAGNAAAHFRTEGGAVIKLYQQTTGVAAAAFVANSGTAVNDASTFGGYTLKQIVQALQNAGFLA